MSGDRHHDDGSPAHLSTEEARSGATPHMTRHILGWGLALVIVGFLAVLLYYMLRT